MSTRMRLVVMTLSLVSYSPSLSCIVQRLTVSFLYSTATTHCFFLVFYSDSLSLSCILQPLTVSFLYSTATHCLFLVFYSDSLSLSCIVQRLTVSFLYSTATHCLFLVFYSVSHWLFLLNGNMGQSEMSDKSKDLQ